MKKKIRANLPYKEYENSEKDIYRLTVKVPYLTNKNSKITIMKTPHLGGVIKLTLTEEVYIREDSEKIDMLDLPRTLWDKFDLHPISQMEDLGSFRLNLDEVDGGIIEICIPELSNEFISFDKNQAQFIKILDEADDWVSSQYIVNQTKYKSQDSLRKARDSINRKFKEFSEGMSNKQSQLIYTQQGKGYRINQFYRRRKEVE